MRLLKNIGKPEIRYHYKLVLECSIIASLLILILAFKFFPHLEKRGLEFEVPQELFTVEDIQQTKQQTVPPPPPEKPSMIIEAVTDADIEDIEFEETELDFDKEMSAPPPPNTASSRSPSERSCCARAGRGPSTRGSSTRRLSRSPAPSWWHW